MLKDFILKQAYLPNGWADNVHITLSESGEIQTVTPNSSDKDIPVYGTAIPGIPNIHSHAFQRAMSGLVEYRGKSNDSFWTWRDVMYRFANRLAVEDIHNVTSMVYMEMLKCGYTSVCEFHYLHHQEDGSFYKNPNETSLVIKKAADKSGIGLTLLPTLYMTAGFDNQPIQNEQRRFYYHVDDYCNLIDSLVSEFSQDQRHHLGIAFHSLRAVPADAIHAVLENTRTMKLAIPIHIHISEQQKEVEDCINWSGKRPVQWLLDEFDINNEWCLIHATHINQDEVRDLAQTGAIIGLCPTTEANLGDGVFPLQQFQDLGGQISIGSDSNVSLSPVEELRWLEYGQRLSTKGRNITSQNSTVHCGESLLQSIYKSASFPCGRKLGAISPGYRADLVFLDTESPQFARKEIKYLLDSFIFSGNENPVKDVMVGGEWVVRDFKHVRQTEIFESYKTTIQELLPMLD